MIRNHLNTSSRARSFNAVIMHLMNSRHRPMFCADEKTDVMDDTTHFEILKKHAWLTTIIALRLVE